MTVRAVGFAFDPETREWTKRVEYNARDRMEAIRWINCSQDYLRDAHIEEPQEPKLRVINLVLPRHRKYR
jgi:proline racemase